MRALKTEEESVSSFDEGSNFMVPGKPENQGSSSVTPADAEYWSSSVLQDAAMMYWLRAIPSRCFLLIGIVAVCHSQPSTPVDRFQKESRTFRA